MHPEVHAPFTASCIDSTGWQEHTEESQAMSVVPSQELSQFLCIPMTFQ